MFHPFDHEPRAIEFYLCELRAQAAKDRLARQACRRRQGDQRRRWRQRVGALLVATGKMLVGPTGKRVREESEAQ